MQQLKASHLLLALAALGVCVAAPVQAKKPTKQETLSALSAEVIEAYEKASCKDLAKGKEAGKSKNHDALRIYLIQNPADRETFLNQVMPATIAKLTRCKLI